jgi:hypothetical protein
LKFVGCRFTMTATIALCVRCGIDDFLPEQMPNY